MREGGKEAVPDIGCCLLVILAAAIAAALCDGVVAIFLLFLELKLFLGGVKTVCAGGIGGGLESLPTSIHEELPAGLLLPSE